ncbi:MULTISPECIES: hypothetical protein [unclassified Breznakia]|uniref:hypothetical protein n=1 Tax=unclassified Breznakia TaxID=2623764 RepID=UPI00247601A1|nr:MULTISPECIES: hypothetical protein [unclassified Breznakia]MDH6367055.1 hypothetical protein [Breznakia sp. PH1-1]MDH6404173.1 hypothetical protein [Breznakia sp. PF1-11]MDH6411942.1 hypothetical protein [Breznakia sp. PFB1-11]MDH6414161.1 hypothetical protein [Breznakia sp. PFB1-14]MDH6418914.1 hypothetical protein [Breznakia sp. PFB1-12]
MVNLNPIDKRRTVKNLKEALKPLRAAFELGLVTLPEYQHYEIDEYTSFRKDLIVISNSEYDALIHKVLCAFDKLPTEQKQIMYYVYIKGISLCGLSSGDNDLDLEITSAYYQHKKAINVLIYAFQELIVYKKEEELSWV